MSNNAVFQSNWSESLLHESQPLDNRLDLKSWLRCNFIFSLATYTYSVGVGGRRDQLFYYCWIQIAAAEATAEAELRQSLKELREKMDDEREQALEEARLVNKFS